MRALVDRPDAGFVEVDARVAVGAGYLLRVVDVDVMAMNSGGLRVVAGKTTFAVPGFNAILPPDRRILIVWLGEACAPVLEWTVSESETVRGVAGPEGTPSCGSLAGEMPFPNFSLIL